MICRDCVVIITLGFPYGETSPGMIGSRLVWCHGSAFLLLLRLTSLFRLLNLTHLDELTVTHDEDSSVQSFPYLYRHAGQICARGSLHRGVRTSVKRNYAAAIGLPRVALGKMSTHLSATTPRRRRAVAEPDAILAYA